MKFGKVLGFAAVGIAAVAAAPFTGGGSILAAGTGIAGSLAGAGAVATAVGAGAAGATAGAILSKKEEEEKHEQERKVASLSLEAEKAKKVLQEHKEYTSLLIALTALAVSMANVDGEISEEERVELDEFIGGVASQGYPAHITAKISQLVEEPPTFNEAMRYLDKVDQVEYPAIRDLLVSVMEADGIIHPKEKAFLSAYDAHIAMSSN